MAMRKRKGHDDREHAPLPPSASKRWLTCSPSQGYIRRLIELGIIKKRESGPAAQRGTRIHEIAEPWLRALLVNPKAKYRPAAKADKGEVAEAKAYVEFCLMRWEQAQELDPQAMCGVEHRSTVTDECWGSCDFWIFAAKRFTSIDLKSGRESVETDGNTQLFIYALGIVMERKFVVREVELCLWQPNAFDGQEPERGVVYDQKRFTEEVKKVKAGIAEATRYLDPTISDIETYLAKLVAGEHCGWCDALGVCPEARRRNSEISSKNFTPVPIDRAEPPPPATLEPDQVAEIMRRAPMFVAWLDAVQTRALELMHKGQRVPGFKVVQKITRRAWSEGVTDAQIAKAVGAKVSEVTKTVRLSPAQVEEQIKGSKDKIKRLVFKPEGDPVVVADSDRRVPLLATKINFTPVSREEEND
jgi:hypothetical protein